jgi:hypothetical protein
VQVVVVGQDANQDDRARDRERDAEDEARGPAPATRPGDQRAQHRRGEALPDRPGHRHAPYGKQLLEVRLQSDAKHQEDDANLGQLFSHGSVGDKSRSMRADEGSSEEVADDRRQSEALRHIAKHERRGEPARHRENQVEPVHHVSAAPFVRSLSKDQRPIRSWFDQLTTSGVSAQRQVLMNG